MSSEIKNNTSEVSLKDVVEVVIKNKKLYFYVSAVTFAALMIAFLFFLTPVYEVDASLEIRQQNASPLSFNPMSFLMAGNVMSDNSIDYELLRSRRILDQTIIKNNLQMKISKKRNTMFKYFWEKLLQKEPLDSFIYFSKIPEKIMSDSGDIEASESGYSIIFDGQKSDCVWGADCSFAGETVAVNKIGPIVDIAGFEFEYENIVDARKRVKDAINIQKAEESEMIVLNFTHESPLMGSYILNDIVSAYIKIKNEWENDDINSKKNYINSTLAELSSSLEEKTQKMIVFQQQEKTLMPEVEIPELLKKQEALKIQIEELKFKRELIANAKSNIDKSPGTPITVPFTFEDLATQEALKNHNKLLAKKIEFSQKMTPNHPYILGVEKEIEESTTSLKNMLSDNLGQYDKGIKILEDLSSLISKGQGKLPETLFAFARLKRDVQLAETVFVTLSAKLYESAIQPNVGVVPVRLIDIPDPIVMRSFPKARVFAIIIIILTLFSGILAIFIKESTVSIMKNLK